MEGLLTLFQPNVLKEESQLQKQPPTHILQIPLAITFGTVRRKKLFLYVLSQKKHQVLYDLALNHSHQKDHQNPHFSVIARFVSLELNQNVNKCIPLRQTSLVHISKCLPEIVVLQVLGVNIRHFFQRTPFHLTFFCRNSSFALHSSHTTHT